MKGPIGYSQALALKRMHRDVCVFAIRWGNNDVLLDLVGKTVLGSALRLRLFKPDAGSLAARSH